MAKGKFSVPRTLQAQPNPASTRKGQKRFNQPEEYRPESINTELDYVHERLNQITVEAPAVPDLDVAAATLAEANERINYLTQLVRDAGLLRSE